MPGEGFRGQGEIRRALERKGKVDKNPEETPFFKERRPWGNWGEQERGGASKKRDRQDV